MYEKVKENREYKNILDSIKNEYDGKRLLILAHGVIRFRTIICEDTAKTKSIKIGSKKSSK